MWRRITVTLSPAGNPTSVSRAETSSGVPKGVWSKLNEYVETVLVTAAQAVAVQEGLSAVGAAAINGAEFGISAGHSEGRSDGLPLDPPGDVERTLSMTA